MVLFFWVGFQNMELAGISIMVFGSLVRVHHISLRPQDSVIKNNFYVNDLIICRPAAAALHKAAETSRDKPSWKIIPRLSFLTISQFLLSPSPQPKRVRIIHNTSFMARLIPRCVCPGTLQYFCFPCRIVVN